jgi:UDP-N-acetylmuramate dehydrogenase
MGLMNLQQNINLSNYSTMGLGGIAAYLVEVNSKLEVKEAHEYAKANSLPVIMIGGGSNIIWKDEGFGGLVIVNKIKGYTVYEMDETNVYITVGSGEVWDDVVARTVENGLTGIEALSLIPGSAGATPVQNV